MLNLKKKLTFFAFILLCGLSYSPASHAVLAMTMGYGPYGPMTYTVYAHSTWSIADSLNYEAALSVNIFGVSIPCCDAIAQDFEPTLSWLFHIAYVDSPSFAVGKLGSTFSLYVADPPPYFQIVTQQSGTVVLIP